MTKLITQFGIHTIGLWARSLLAKKPFRLLAVALANKMARTAWAIMAKGVTYEA